MIFDSLNKKTLIADSFEKGKAVPVGTINNYQEMKMGDGSWKYVGKQGHNHPVAIKARKAGHYNYKDAHVVDFKKNAPKTGKEYKAKKLRHGLSVEYNSHTKKYMFLKDGGIMENFSTPEAAELAASKEQKYLDKEKKKTPQQFRIQEYDNGNLSKDSKIKWDGDIYKQAGPIDSKGYVGLDSTGNGAPDLIPGVGHLKVHVSELQFKQSDKSYKPMPKEVLDSVAEHIDSTKSIKKKKVVSSPYLELHKTLPSSVGGFKKVVVEKNEQIQKYGVEFEARGGEQFDDYGDKIPDKQMMSKVNKVLTAYRKNGYEVDYTPQEKGWVSIFIKPKVEKSETSDLQKAFSELGV